MSTVHFAEGHSVSWNYANRSYDDSGCWEDSMSADDYEEKLEQRRYEQSHGRLYRRSHGY